MRSIVVVNGPPASCKTTLAVALADHLGFAYVGKDTIKEALAEALGDQGGEAGWSRRLGGASFNVMFAVAHHVPEVILEAPFGDSARDKLLALAPAPVEVFCSCPPEELAHREQARRSRRHSVHHTTPTVMGSEPLRLGGPLIVVDTSRPVDAEALARRVVAHVAPDRNGPR